MNQFLKKWYIWRSINQNLVSNVWLKKLLFFIQKLEIKISVCPQLKVTSVYHHFFGFVDDLGNLEKQKILVTFSFERMTNSHTTEVWLSFVIVIQCDSIFFGSDSEGGQIIW